MTTRALWLCVALLVAGTLWLLGGAVRTIARPTPAGTTSTTWYSGDGDAVEIRP